MKRAIDIVGSASALVILSPLMIVIALLIRATSSGPALFRQRRVGMGGEEFEIFKFRSMTAGADSVGPYFTDAGDRRITRLGRVLRRTSLDEFPQFLNVLRGEMSLVGPRPDVPQQVINYSEEEWRLRHAVRPGITGLAQAKLRSSATPEQRLQLDLQYAQQHSVALDFKILGMTLLQVLGRGGH